MKTHENISVFSIITHSLVIMSYFFKLLLFIFLLTIEFNRLSKTIIINKKIIQPIYGKVGLNYNNCNMNIRLNAMFSIMI